LVIKKQFKLWGENVSLCSKVIAKKHKYSVGRMYNYLMFNMLVYLEPVGFTRLKTSRLQ